MEPDPPGGVVQGEEEASAEGEAAVVGWEAHALELVRVVVVSALIVVPGFPIKWEHPAIT